MKFRTGAGCVEQHLQFVAKHHIILLEIERHETIPFDAFENVDTEISFHHRF